MTLYEAILECFIEKQKPMTIQEVEIYIGQQYKQKWKDIGTTLADMVPVIMVGILLRLYQQNIED